MAWENLKSAVDAIITTNGNNEITGALLNTLINDNIIPKLGASKFKGIAIPSTVPPAYEYDVFYIALLQGSYANFGGASVNEGITVLKYTNPGGWVAQELLNLSVFNASLDGKTDKGGYAGTTQNLKDYVDSLVFTGAITYQTQAELPTSPVPPNGTPAIVANDGDPTNNGGWAVSGGAWVQNYVELGDTVVSNTVATASALSLAEGTFVKTRGYGAIGDGGSGLYEVRNTYPYVDNVGLGFDLPNGKKLVLISDVKKVAHFGVFADGVTNWESTEGPKFTGIKNASQIYRIHWAQGLYKTGFNINNTHSGMKMHFDNTEFGSLLHLLSGSEILNEKGISSLSSAGGVVTVTTVSSHNMGDNRKVFFQNTGTDIDAGEYMTTITGTNTFTIVSPADVSGYTSGGFVTDSPLKDVSFTGTVTAYGRFGTINLQNFHFDTVKVASDASKHVSGVESRGVHIYSKCRDWYGRTLICEDTDLQAASVNLHAAVAIDGTGQENINIDTIHVYDSGVNGVILQTNGLSCRKIIVDGYGRGALGTSPIAATPTDYHGKSMPSVACGVWLIRGACDIGMIQVKNKNSRGEAYTFTERPNVYADVMIDRSYIDWDLGLATYVESRATQTIGNIICENVLNMAVASADAVLNVKIESLNVYRIAADNPMITDPAERAKYGLIFHQDGRLEIGKATFNDLDYCPAFRSLYTTKLNSFFELRNLYVQSHKSTIGVCGNSFRVENIYAAKRVAGDDNFALVFEDNTRSMTGVARGIKLMNLNNVPSRGIDFKTKYATLENVCLWSHGTSTGPTINFSGRFSKVSNVYMSGNSEAGADGFNYDSPYRGRTDSVEVSGFNGTGVTGTGPNIIATNCISIGNGTATSLATAQVVTACQTGFGNFSWTV